MGKPIVELHACLAVPLMLTTTFPPQASQPSPSALKVGIKPSFSAPGGVHSHLHCDNLFMQSLVARTMGKGVLEQELPPSPPFGAKLRHGISVFGTPPNFLV